MACAFVMFVAFRAVVYLVCAFVSICVFVMFVILFAVVPTVFLAGVLVCDCVRWMSLVTVIVSLAVCYYY